MTQRFCGHCWNVKRQQADFAKQLSAALALLRPISSDQRPVGLPRVAGSAVYVEGRIRTRKWQDKDGQDRYTTGVEAADMKMLGGVSAGTDEGSRAGRQAGGGADDARPRPSRRDDVVPVLDDDHIPF